jgi:outer membrane protein assembly factor BamB
VALAPSLVALIATLAGCAGGRKPADWPLPNQNLSSTRALSSSGIDATNVRRLHVAWRFRLPVAPGESGAFAATPIVVAGTVYAQDLKSNVYALDLATGKPLWRRLFAASNPGPNGLAASKGRIFGVTDTSAFALDARTGRVLWRRFLVTPAARYVEIAPQVSDGLVYLSTIGLPPNGRGVLYALDASTGAIRWQLSTVARPWRVPSEAGGGGAWQTPSVDGGEVFWGIGNPYPYGGSRGHPNGGAFAGPALYTDSLLVTDARTGSIRWFDQVTPHDVRDYDFQLPPVLGSAGLTKAVFGAGKAGIVIAWDRATHQRIWQTVVGVHRNDHGPLPSHDVSVCPGLLGGVETPMASADGMLFVPVVDLCMRGSATGYEPLEGVNVSARGRGELVALDEATGVKRWAVRFPQANFGCATVARGVVFTATLDGTVYGIDSANGRILWRAKALAGINACPALARGTLLVGAGVPLSGRSRLELTAYTVGDVG